MTKKDLITLISQESNLSKKESYLAIEAVMKTITHELIKKTQLHFWGLGIFQQHIALRIKVTLHKPENIF